MASQAERRSTGWRTVALVLLAVTFVLLIDLMLIEYHDDRAAALQVILPIVTGALAGLAAIIHMARNGWSHRGVVSPDADGNADRTPTPPR
jgi:hypothetical protein